MRRKMQWLLVIVILMSLTACAGWQENMVKGYEAVGVLGKTYKGFGQSACEAGTVKPADCERLKKINNDAQKVYVQAGDALSLAIKVEDSIQRQQFLAEYNSLMADVNKIMLNLVKTLRELKVIGGGN